MIEQQRRPAAPRACARVAHPTTLPPPPAWPLFNRSVVAAFERSVTPKQHNLSKESPVLSFWCGALCIQALARGDL